MKRFSGKSVVVTGASRGIGLAIARRFAEEGGRVTLSANEALVEEAAAAIRRDGGDAQAVITDVTSMSDVTALYDAAERHHGRVDISIQNAGVITIDRIEDLPEHDWDKVLAVNTKGVFLCCQEAIRRMRRHGAGGRLINAASGQARQGFIYTPHYAASKFGVIGITQSLAKEVAAEGITVNAICPGIVATDMWQYNDARWGELLGSYAPGELMAEWVANIPMKRAAAPAEIAGVVAFMSSDDAAYITGQAINIDGGLIMS